MDQFRPLGRRDIFGILLPGAIVVFALAYALFGMLALLQLPAKDLLDQQLLLAVVLFVAAYLVGSVLRLYAADDVDSMSGEYGVKAWCKGHHAGIESSCMSDFRKHMAELARGNDPSDVPDGRIAGLFDEWLRYADEFPYQASLNRIWRTHGFCEVLNFFQGNYRTRMWPEKSVSRKSFFNYCKLAVIESGGALADEVNAAEGVTRFFAGTAIALRVSTWLLAASLLAQLLLVAVLTLAPRWGIKPAVSVQWISQGFILVFTLVLTFIFQWIRRQIVKRFRGVRFREAETVYYAFYLYSMSHPDVSMGGQPVSQEASA